MVEITQTQDERALEIIKLRDRERDNQVNFRSRWQETADLVFPRENQITSIRTPGEDKSLYLYDTTAVQDSQEMASGLSATLIPINQKFFTLSPKNKDLDEVDRVQRYLAKAVEVAHEEMFESNLLLQLNETLRSLVVFGTGCLFSEWDAKIGQLNYRDYDISLYQILEDNHGNVDTIILTFSMTARQAAQEFGRDKLPTLVAEALEKSETRHKVFEFIHYVGPRENKNPRLIDSRNMSWESIYVGVKDKAIIDEGGFEEFPFAVGRWMKSSYEVYGRGQATENLSVIKTLQRIMGDYVDLANRYANPPKEVLDSFEGTVDVRPNALNYVQQMNSIQGIGQQTLGNFPVTKDMLLFHQDAVDRKFYRDIFRQLGTLTGDRRTRLEIYERIREAFRLLSSPIMRLQSELLNPLVVRSILLLIRNDRIPLPPPELIARRGSFTFMDLGIEYIGELALALKDQQSKGFLQFVAFLSELVTIYPDARDVIDVDGALPDIALSYGVKTEHISSKEEIAAKRAARAQQQAAQMALQLAATGAEAYGKTSKKAEAGSPAEQVQTALTGA